MTCIAMYATFDLVFKVEFNIFFLLVFFSSLALILCQPVQEVTFIVRSC